MHKRATYRDLAQEVLQDPDADIMTERSWTRDPQTEILHKCSFRILGDLDKDPHTPILHKCKNHAQAQEILIQSSCTSGPRGSSYRRPDSDILHKRSSYSDLAQVALEAADAEILTRTWHPRFPTRKHRNTVWGLLPGYFFFVILLFLFFCFFVIFVISPLLFSFGIIIFIAHLQNVHQYQMHITSNDATLL